MNSYDPYDLTGFSCVSSIVSPKHMNVIPQKFISDVSVQQHDLVYKPIQTDMGNCHTKRYGNNC